MIGNLTPPQQEPRSPLSISSGRGLQSGFGQDLDTNGLDNINWDLSHISDALHALSYQSVDNDPALPATYNATAPAGPPSVGGPDLITTSVASNQQQTYQLGNFDEIWKYLGEVCMAEVALDSPPSDLKLAESISAPAPGIKLPLTPGSSPKHPVDETLSKSVEDNKFANPATDLYSLAVPPESVAYISDGAIYNPPTARGVRFHAHLDESGDDDGQGNQAEVEKKLTKTQRKKLNRRIRKEAEKNQVIASPKGGSDAELEAPVHSLRTTPARKASMHVLPSDVSSSLSVPADFQSLESFIKPPKKGKKSIAEKQAVSAFSQAQEALAPSPLPLEPKSKRMGKRHGSKNGIKMEPRSATPLRGSSTSYFDYKNMTPSTAHVQPSFAPSSVRLAQPAVTTGDAVTTPKAMSTPKRSQKTPGKAYETLGHDVYDYPEQNSRRWRGQNENVCSPLPRINQDQLDVTKILRGTDRHLSLWNKLSRDFPDDAKWLYAPAQMNDAPGAIHVFVDASNILIGFSERMRVTGLRRQFPKVNLSFDSLVLLMERRRPLAKRSLVGSFDTSGPVVAFDIAKAVGYETNILDKVSKARELTDRQLFFRMQDGRPVLTSDDLAKAVGSEKGVGSHSKTPAGNKVGTLGSPMKSAATKGPFFAPAAHCEQGVDEILHLKMLQSMVDYMDTPGTMVLATGDAAAAEFSDGFLKNVERALERGWKVELVTWAKGISSAYRRRDFLARWGNQFRIIYLDEYLFDLMDI